MGCYKIQQEALAAEDKLVSISAFVNMIGKPSISHGTTRTLVEAMVCALSPPILLELLITFR